MNALKQWDNCSRKSKRLSKSFRASISAASKSSTDGLVAISRRAYCLIPHKSPRLTPKSSPCPRLKKALDLEKMRSAGYSHMIELAEQHSTFRSEKIWHQTVGWLRSTWPRISLDKCCICQTLHQPFRSPVLCVGYLPTPIKPPGEVVHHFDVYRVEFGKALCQTRLYRLQVLR